MFLFRSIVLVVVMGLLAPAGAFAVDPAQFDILDLRLGMTVQRVTEILAHQGWRAARSTDAVRARTPDGALTIELSGDGRARRIVYTFTSNEPRDVALIRAALVDHFGEPLTDTPMVWCRRADGNGGCPASRPRLTFQSNGRSGGVLTLSDGDDG